MGSENKDTALLKRKYELYKQNLEQLPPEAEDHPSVIGWIFSFNSIKEFSDYLRAASEVPELKKFLFHVKQKEYFGGKIPPHFPLIVPAEFFTSKYDPKRLGLLIWALFVKKYARFLSTGKLTIKVVERAYKISNLEHQLLDKHGSTRAEYYDDYILISDWKGLTPTIQQQAEDWHKALKYIADWLDFIDQKIDQFLKDEDSETQKEKRKTPKEQKGGWLWGEDSPVRVVRRAGNPQLKVAGSGAVLMYPGTDQPLRLKPLSSGGEVFAGWPLPPALKRQAAGFEAAFGGPLSTPGQRVDTWMEVTEDGRFAIDYDGSSVQWTCTGTHQPTDQSFASLTPTMQTRLRMLIDTHLTAFQHVGPGLQFVSKQRYVSMEGRPPPSEAFLDAVGLASLSETLVPYFDILGAFEASLSAATSGDDATAEQSDFVAIILNSRLKGAGKASGVMQALAREARTGQIQAGQPQAA